MTHEECWQAVREFIHAVNSPLSTISMAEQLLAKEQDPDTVAVVREVLEGRVEEINRLMEELRTQLRPAPPGPPAGAP